MANQKHIVTAFLVLALSGLGAGTACARAKHGARARRLTFTAMDGLEVTANFYPSRRKQSRGTMLLCHQAGGWSLQRRCATE